MMLGIPTLATKVGSFENRITDGVNGFLVSPHKKSLVKKIQELHEHRELILSVSKKLKYWSHKTKKEMVDEYHKFLSVVNNSEYQKIPEFNTLNMLQGELERIYGKVADSVNELYKMEVKLKQTESQLNQTKMRITAMETSKFWKFRKYWFKVKRALRIPGEE